MWCHVPSMTSYTTLFSPSSKVGGVRISGKDWDGG